MSLEQVRERTTVFDSDYFYAYGISWQCTHVERIYAFPDGDYFSYADGDTFFYDDGGVETHADVVGYMFAKMLIHHPMSQFDIPTEFFNHQLLECDPDDEESLFRFIQKWGMPFSPSRNDSFCLGRYPLSVRKRGRRAIKLTGVLEQNATDAADRERGDGCASSTNVSYGLVISREEAAFSIWLMQDIVRSIRSAISGETTNVVLEPINAAACYPHVVLFGMVSRPSEDVFCERLSTHGLLISAICNQIIETIADDAPWRMCACDGCETVFKRKQGKVATRPSSDSIYCCTACEERQKKRNQRAAAKNRIQH